MYCHLWYLNATLYIHYHFVNVYQCCHMDQSGCMPKFRPFNTHWRAIFTQSFTRSIFAWHTQKYPTVDNECLTQVTVLLGPKWYCNIIIISWLLWLFEMCTPKLIIHNHVRLLYFPWILIIRKVIIRAKIYNVDFLESYMKCVFWCSLTFL